MQGTLKSTSMGCFSNGGNRNRLDKRCSALIGSVSDDPYDYPYICKSVSCGKGFSVMSVQNSFPTSRHTLTERGYFARPGETTRGTNEKGLSFYLRDGDRGRG